MPINRPLCRLSSHRALTLVVSIPRIGTITSSAAVSTPPTPRLALPTAAAALRRHQVTRPVSTRASTHPGSNIDRTKASGKMSSSTNQEKEVKRNPHPDFKGVEASRPDWDAGRRFGYTKTPNPDWTWGDGANSLHGNHSAGGDDAKQKHEHIAIDPYEDGRPTPFNYKLLISAIVPRPIGFVSTRSAAAAGADPQYNLAPFSWFNMVSHDPPLFVLGIAGPGGESSKDTLRHLQETRECVVNIIGEDFIEAANATSVDAPGTASEWDLSGLTPVFDCRDVAAPRVGEAVFSVECRLESARELVSKNPATPGRRTGTLVVLEGVRFWARSDALNDDRNLLDPAVLRPMSRLGGITYARVTDAIELPRATFAGDVGGQEGYERIKQKVQEKRGGPAGPASGA